MWSGGLVSGATPPGIFSLLDSLKQDQINQVYV